MILENLYKSMSTTSRLLVIETVMHTGSYSEEKVRRGEREGREGKEGTDGREGT